MLKHNMAEDVGLRRKWFVVGKSSILGPEIMHEAMEKVNMIRIRLGTAYSHQKFYADKRKRAIQFEVGY